MREPAKTGLLEDITVETVKINRRDFLKAAGAGALALGLAPVLLSAAGRNVAPAPAGNPLFTGKIGVYEGVTIYDRGELRAVQDAMRDLEYYSGDQWSKAQQGILSRRG